MAKACVIYVGDMGQEADQVSAKLASEGYEVCLHEVDMETARAARSGYMASDDLKECINSSDVVLFLIPKMKGDFFGGMVGEAVACGKRVVGVGDVRLVPDILDELADSLVSIHSDSFIRAMTEKVWESGKVREIDRIKCQ